MGKPSRLRRNKLRMTLFNLAKSIQQNTVQQNTIKNLYIQVSSLKEEIKRLNENLRIANSNILSAKVNEPITSSDRLIPNESTNDNISEVPNSSSDLTVPSVESNESNQATLQSNYNSDSPPTAEFFIKLMDELHNENLNFIDELFNKPLPSDITWYSYFIFKVLFILMYCKFKINNDLVMVASWNIR